MNRPFTQIWMGCCILLLFFSLQKVEAQQAELLLYQQPVAESIKSIDSARLNAFRNLEATANNHKIFGL